MPANHLLRVPALRRKSTGNHFVRFWVDGKPKDHSLGTDPALAQLRYKEALARWATNREQVAPPAEPKPGIRVIEVASMMFDWYAARGRDDAEADWRAHLARFLNKHGAAELLSLAIAKPEAGRFAPAILRLLEAHVEDYLKPGALTPTTGYAPRTVNHDVAAIKRLFNWAGERGLCPPIPWKGIGRVRLPRSEPEELTPSQVQAMVQRAQEADPRLAAYLALQYLCCLRPSEVIRLVLFKRTPGGRASAPNRKPGLHRIDTTAPVGDAIGRFRPVKDHHGKLVNPRGLFELRVHKNSWRDAEDTEGRFIILTDEALEWFDRAEPVWSHPSSLTHAAALHLGASGGSTSWGGPHVLRDSAASSLRSLGVAAGDVATLLGHRRPGVLHCYAREPWHTLRASAAGLTLKSGIGPRRRSLS